MESVTQFLFRPHFVATVLNAFRHHGIGHGNWEGARTYAGSAQRLPASWNRSHIECESCHTEQRCSTPSGIMESVTIAGGEIDLNDDGAQRLPASWNRSPANITTTNASTVCSTPSGIMESVTLPHQSQKIRPERAQRLPASWNRSRCPEC